MTSRDRKFTQSSNATEVKDILGWSKVQWSRFKVCQKLLVCITANHVQVITMDEYNKHKDLWSYSNSLNWREVVANIQEKIIKEVNEKLEAEILGKDNSKDLLETAIDWRMRQIFKGKKPRHNGKDFCVFFFNCHLLRCYDSEF